MFKNVQQLVMPIEIVQLCMEGMGGGGTASNTIQSGTAFHAHTTC